MNTTAPDVSILAQTWKNLSYGQAARNELLLMSVADEVVDLCPIRVNAIRPEFLTQQVSCFRGVALRDDLRPFPSH